MQVLIDGGRLSASAVMVASAGPVQLLTFPFPDASSTYSSQINVAVEVSNKISGMQIVLFAFAELCLFPFWLLIKLWRRGIEDH